MLRKQQSRTPGSRTGSNLLKLNIAMVRGIPMTSLSCSTFLDISDDQLKNTDSTGKSVLPDKKQVENKGANQHK